MDLQTYFKENPGARQAMSSDLGVSPNYLWQIAVRNNDRQPSVKLAKRIHQYTDGVVTLETLRPDVWGVDVDNQNAQSRKRRKR